MFESSYVLEIHSEISVDTTIHCLGFALNNGGGGGVRRVRGRSDETRLVTC